MALTGANCLSKHAPNRKRAIYGYVLVSYPALVDVELLTNLGLNQHARAAYARCNGFGLVRYTDELFPEAVASLESPSRSPWLSDNPAARTCESIPGDSCADRCEIHDESVSESQALPDATGKDGSKESMLERKLSLESVLRSL